MKNRNVFMGVLLIVMAIFLIFSQFGWIVPGIGTGKVLLGVFFGGLLIKGVREKNFFGMFFPGAFLWLIFDDVLGIHEISIGPAIVVALLFSIGFSCLFPEKQHWEKKTVNWDDYENGDKVGEHQRVVDERTENTVYCSNVFGATTKYINSNNLQRATLDCSFGEIKAYFDNAVVQNSSVEICVHVSFGSIELYIPREWTVVQNPSIFAGSVNEKNRNCSDGRPVVELIGEINFGNVTIIYV